MQLGDYALPRSPTRQLVQGRSQRWQHGWRTRLRLGLADSDGGRGCRDGVSSCQHVGKAVQVRGALACVQQYLESEGMPRPTDNTSYKEEIQGCRQIHAAQPISQGAQ